MKLIPNLALRFILPRLGDILMIGILIGVVGMGPRLLNVDGDLGRHLTLGHFIIDRGQIPTQDLFSHTMQGQPLTPHEWLAEVAYALAYRWSGLDGVVLLCALVLVITFYLLYRLILRLTGQVLLSLGFCIAAMAASTLHWLARPHLFTLLLVVVWLWGMEITRTGKRHPLVWMPVVMLIWANLHGAFIAGFVIWFAYGIGAIWSTWLSRSSPDPLPAGFFTTWLGTGILSFLFSLINPVGIHLWGTSLGYLQNSYLVGHTAEYLSPDFHQVSTWPFLGMVMLSLLLLGLGRPKLQAHWVFLVAGWTGLALMSVRNVPLYALVSAPALASGASGWISDRATDPPYLRLERRLLRMERYLLGYFWPVIMMLLIGFLLYRGANLDMMQKGNRFDPNVFPVEAVDWLADHPQDGEMFNYFPWGGYLLYRSWPEKKVFIDGQTDFYGEQLTRQYEQGLTASEGWELVLNSYKVGWVLMPPGAPLSQTLTSHPEWQRVYHDATADIYSRNR